MFKLSWGCFSQSWPFVCDRVILKINRIVTIMIWRDTNTQFSMMETAPIHSQPKLQITDVFSSFGRTGMKVCIFMYTILRASPADLYTIATGYRIWFHQSVHIQSTTAYFVVMLLHRIFTLSSKLSTEYKKLSVFIKSPSFYPSGFGFWR